jgi:glyoxylase-like metal-dependent hydrolase (beta-lactamase superfamily II)
MTKDHVGPLSVGAATVHIFNVGNLKHSLRDSLKLPESVWKGRYDTLFVDWIPVPVQAALIQTTDATVLVDAPSSDMGPETDLLIPGYMPPPSLITQLATVGVGPEDVTHVVITHTHFDHYNGLATTSGARPVALYPQARVLVGRADWERLAADEEFVEGVSHIGKLFAPYHAAGRIDLVDVPVTLGEGVTALPSPSETPGHLTVGIQSQGITLYCIGDIYHHWVEVENRSWMVDWADAELTVAEREKLEATALKEDAMLMASHIRGVGRLARAGDGVRWQELAV